MKHFIIQVRRYPQSVKMANTALLSAKQWEWDIELYNGVDGSLISAGSMKQRWGVDICKESRKTYRTMNEHAGIRGCFMSHWLLWNLCRDRGQSIGIFEHDVTFNGPPTYRMPKHLLKLEGFNPKPPRTAGIWYEGARAYIITPEGADRLLAWIKCNGCLPADVVIGSDVLDIELDPNNLISLQFDHDDKISSHVNSFTWNLSGMLRQ